MSRNLDGPLAHLREHGELIDRDVEFIRRQRGLDGRVLDVGAGRGSFVAEARRRGLDAVCADRQGEASAVWAQSGLPGALADAHQLPFLPASFRFVRMKEILEHVEDPLSLVLEAKRVLTRDGYLIAHVPTPYSTLYPVANFWDDYTHVRPISRYGLQRLFEDAGMRVELIQGYTSGRSALERALGSVLGRVLPHQYYVLARKRSE